MTDLIPSMTADTAGSSRGPSNSELSSEAIRSQKFDTSFRGYDTAQVRQFLGRVGAHVSNLQDKTAGLSLELESARSVRPVIDLTEPTVRPDSDATVELLVDQEAASQAEQLLEDARREAKAIIDRANDEAGRIMLRARAESRGKQYDGSRVIVTDGPVGLGDTDVEVDAQTPEAAREQARAMIAEARAVRERILTDLAKRRRTAHVQLEQLRVGREKLLETMREARRVVDVATADLLHAETEARLAAEAAGRRVSEEPMPTAEQLGAELTGGRHLSSNRSLGVVVTTVDDDGSHESSAGSLVELADDQVNEPMTAPAAEAVDVTVGAAAFPADGDDETPTVELRMSDLVEISEISEVVEVVEVVDLVEVVELVDVVEVSGVVEGAEVVETFAVVETLAVAETVAVVELVELVELVDVVEVVEAPEAVEGIEVETVVEAPEAVENVTVVETVESTGPAEDQVPTSFESTVRPVVRKRSAGAAFAQLRAGTTATVAPVAEQELSAQIVAPSKKPKTAAKVRREHALAPDQTVSPDPVSPDPVLAEAAEPAPSAESSELTPVFVAEVAVAAADVAGAILERRGAELELLQLRVTRRLKRQLQDDHSAALSSVRRARGQATVASLLGDTDIARQRLVDVLEPGMQEACESGRRSMAMVLGQPLKPHQGASAATPLSVASQLAADVLDDITSHVEAALAEGSTEYSTVLGSAFRDWSTDRIGLEVAASLCAAFGVGAAGQIEPGTAVSWVVDHGDDPSPDCDDNSLAGSVALGHTFPTGHALPPLGAGCRCIVVPSVG